MQGGPRAGGSASAGRARAPGRGGTPASARAGAARPPRRAPRGCGAGRRAGSVLERAQERVGVVQRPAVLPTDVAALGEVGQGAQRWRADLLVGAPVDHLEQLHGELHVAQATRPELELALGLPGRDVGHDAAAHGLHLVDEAVALGGRPDERADEVGVRLAQGGASPATGRALSSAWNSQSWPTGRSSPRGWPACAPAGRGALGRRLASTGQIVPSRVCSEQTCIIVEASWVAARSAGWSGCPSTGSATKTTSTSLT